MVQWGHSMFVEIGRNPMGEGESHEGNRMGGNRMGTQHYV